MSSDDKPHEVTMEEYLNDPGEVFKQTRTRRVHVLDPDDGSVSIVMYPGTIANFQGLDASPSAVAAQEPVCWRYRYGPKGSWRFADSHADCNESPNYEIEPLYTAPASSERAPESYKQARAELERSKIHGPDSRTIDELEYVLQRLDAAERDFIQVHHNCIAARKEALAPASASAPRELDPYKRNPKVGPCKCGLKQVPAGCDGVQWYWQRHGRDACTLELPNIVCWCGLLRHEHTEGHLAGVEPPSGAATEGRSA